MAINFPNTPTNGQVFTDPNGSKWTYETATNSWTAEGASSQVVDATTTVKGIVQLADDAAITAGTAGRVVDAKELKEELTFLQDGTDAKPRSYLSKLQESVSPEDFGAIGDGVTDDTDALKKAFATGKIVNGHGKTYKVVGDRIIDPFATAGVGYGAGKKWFTSGPCKNIRFNGDVSFGGTFLGKHVSVEEVTVTGDARLSSWFSAFNRIIVTGTAYFNSDVPPAANHWGCYYNTYTNCDFGAGVVDQRYGPFNLNTFTACRFKTFHVKHTGHAGYTNAPPRDFHLNCFYGCEFLTGTGITAPDGGTYPFVVDDNVKVGGINRLIGCYMEGASRGFYGVGLEVDNLHTSGESVKVGGGSLGYNSPFSGESGLVGRDVPNIYPAGSNITGGDWSVLNSAGYPVCLTAGNCSAAVTADSTEPTGLNKKVVFTANVKDAIVYLNFNTEPANRTLKSFAVICKLTGSWTVIGTDVAGAEAYNTASEIKLPDGWVMYVGHTYGTVRFFAATAGSTLSISAISGSRGGGLVSPATVKKPLFDLSGGDSYYADASRFTATKNNINAAGPVNIFKVDLPDANIPTVDFQVSVRFYKPAYPQYTATCTYAVSAVKTTSRTVVAKAVKLIDTYDSLDIVPAPAISATATGPRTVTVAATTGETMLGLSYVVTGFSPSEPGTTFTNLLV